MLTWSLVVCTLNRREILLKCLEATLKQSRQPQQMIIVDASDEWQESKKSIANSLGATLLEPEFIYIGSEIKSLTHQRNVGLKFCRSDVVFFIDDDAFMYADYAEKVMQIYEMDEKGLIGGIMGVLADSEPDKDETSDAVSQAISSDSGIKRLKNSFSNYLSQFWYQTELLIPYNGQYYNYNMGATFGPDLVADIALLHGCRMTFRTNIVREVGGFNEILTRGAIAEDSDLSYRISQKYALVVAFPAKICHLQTQVERLNRFKNVQLGILNAVALFLLNNNFKSGIRLAVYRFALTRLLLEFCRDCFKPQRGFVQTRGALAAMKVIPQIFSMTPEQLRTWYPSFQVSVYQTKSL
ncbi:glycosyltransferase family 2 protein [Microcoleus vaginatus PCC 9802]|uniref:glycosyltransferase family 2 protein n=1 Tax=Microcoleus vaginatus TaxID=119532 RepID=UPI00020D17A6|nr:glycosyl transferase family 2 [Microcoleus vaginatus FGP-2]UNU21494.1 glycosyltransferase family 2 protein [Microcoleus vaginatus PCC 9802]